MEIAWLADFGSEGHPGGAQITNEIFIENSPEKFEIKVYHREDYAEFTPGEQDLIVLNDIHYLPDAKLTKIIDSCCYIKFEHAWQGLEELGRKFPDLYREATGNVFLSPLAEQTYRSHDLLPADESRVVCTPSPIESYFQVRVPVEQRRPPNVGVYTGEMSEHKLNGLLEWLETTEDFTVELYGFDTGYLSTVEDHPRCRYMGYCVHEDLPIVLNQYRNFVHFPRLEPFGRSIAEAYLCGCELISNNRVGFLSYEWDFEDYAQIRQRLVEKAPQNFWEKVESLL